MTTVYSRRWLQAYYLAKESWALTTAFSFPKKTATILLNLRNVCCDAIWQEVLDWDRP